MSGYNRETGIFELTFTIASYWFRRKDIPQKCMALRHTMEFFACLLREEGLEVKDVASRFLRVKATPEQLWKALTGQPSDPKRSAYYHR